MQDENILMEINEVACLDNYMKKHNISKAQLAKDLKIKPQFISRVFTEEERLKLPPALKFALLKYYYYDVEANIEYGNSYNENVTKVPFYEYKLENIKDEDFKSSEFIYFDTRWLTHVLCVNPDNVFMYQLQEDNMESYYALPMHYRLKIDDIVMVDKSAKTSSRRGFFLVFNPENNDILVKCLSSENWEGTAIIEHCILPRRREYASGEPVRTADTFDSKKYTILGKIIWNGSQRFGH